MPYFNSRNIALISLGAFIWSIYFSIQGQYLNDYLLEIANYTPLVISLLVSLVAITGAISSVFAGAINDSLRVEFGRRKLFILIGGCTSAILLFLLPLDQSLLFILGLNVIMSIFNTAAFVCNNSLIPDIAIKSKLGKANAIASFGTSLGTIVGFALMMISPKSNIFFITGAICTFGFLIVGLFFHEPKTSNENKTWFGELKVIRSIFRLGNQKEFYKFLISYSFLHLGINTYMPFLLVFLTQKNDINSGDLIGLGLSIEQGEVLVVFAVMTIISLIVTMPLGIILDRFDKLKFLICSRFLFAISTGLIALTPILKLKNPIVIAIIFIIPFSIANTADIISRGAFMQLLIPEEKRGQLLGLLFFVRTLVQVPGVLLGGLLAHFYPRGYQYNFLIGSFFLFVSIIFLLPARKHLLSNQYREDVSVTN